MDKDIYMSEYVDDRSLMYELDTYVDTEFEGHIDKHFKSQRELENFFFYVEKFFPTFSKAYEFDISIFVTSNWKMWFNTPTRSICFCIKANPELLHHVPVYRIQLKKDAPHFKSNDEKVVYFCFNRECSGLPLNLSSNFVFLHEQILKFIYSERLEHSIGRSGILHFMIHSIIYLPGLKELNIKTNIVENEIQINTFTLGYTYNNFTLSIHEKKDIAYKQRGSLHENLITSESIQYTLSFYKPTFPQDLKIIEVMSTSVFVQNNQEYKKEEILDANSIYKNLFSERNEHTTMINFLEYFMHVFLYSIGTKIQPYGKSKVIHYHPLVMKKLSWNLLKHYMDFMIQPNQCKVYIGVLKDDLSEPDAVDMGGPTKQFIEDLSRQIFQEQTKKLLLYSTGQIALDFSPKVSILSANCWFPIFFDIHDKLEKEKTSMLILEFLKTVYRTDFKIPFVLHPKFFYFFCELGKTNMNVSKGVEKKN